MIRTSNQHGQTIAALHKEGTIKGVHVILPNGEAHEADSILSALDWIKEKGYDRNEVRIVEA